MARAKKREVQRKTSSKILTLWQYKFQGCIDWQDVNADQMNEINESGTITVKTEQFVVDFTDLMGKIDMPDGSQKVLLLKRIECAKEIETNGAKIKEDCAEEPEMKKIKFKGNVPLDSVFVEKHGDNHTIFQDIDGVVYDCMLNQTNIDSNNNKFYLIQLLKKDKSGQFCVWCKSAIRSQQWGRVGANGQSSKTAYTNDVEHAKSNFCQKFESKTNNKWPGCILDKDFVKFPRKYDLLLRDFESEAKDDAALVPRITNIKVPESTLDKRLQSFIEMICNIGSIENSLKELNFDVKRSPLGKLSRDQIKQGYAALKDIEDLIQRNAARSELTVASGLYYTRIPHIFGMRTPPVIATLEAIKCEILLLDALTDAEAAVKVFVDTLTNENPIDKRYKQLKCRLQPIDSDAEDFKLIERCLKSTHGFTHSQYTLELLDLFEVERESEQTKFRDLGKNKFLLYHGSRLMNWAGIVSQGLRIAPPEAPVTGYMFGKGVYFADCSSKSSNYCCTSPSSDVGILLLAEVSLGEMYDQTNAQYDFPKKLPTDRQSVRALGKIIPDESKTVITPSGTKMHFGPLIERQNKSTGQKLVLQYNEFIVYDVSQIKMKYMLKVKFHYKR
ncbi:hypothetical protein ACOME3_001761 [Neoechinorhynchus agilis]